MNEAWYCHLKKNHQRLRAFFFFTLTSFFVFSQFQNCAAPPSFAVKEALEQEKSSLELALKPQTTWQLKKVVHQNNKVDLPVSYVSALEFEEITNEDHMCAGSCPSVYRLVVQQACQKAEGQYIVSFNMLSAEMVHNVYTRIIQNDETCNLKDWDRYIYNYFLSPQVRIERVSNTQLKVHNGDGSYLVYDKR